MPKELQFTFESQAELQLWLHDNEFAGLLTLPNEGTVGDDEVNIPVDKRVLLKLSDLRDGGRYAAVPSRGGLRNLRVQVADLDRGQGNLARQREGEMEQALAKHAPQLLLGVPSWLGVSWFCAVSTRPELQEVKLAGETCEFDAVVEVTLPTGKTFILGELKTTTKGTNDVNKLVGKVNRVKEHFQSTSEEHPFRGRPLRAAFMAEFVSRKVEPRVRDACRTSNVFRLRRGNGGIIVAGLAKESCALHARFH